MADNQLPTPISPESNRRRFGSKKTLILVVGVVLAVGLGSWYVWQTRIKDRGWVEFKDEKSKLTFIYPKDWGEPKITEKAGQKGKLYSIGFIPSKNPSAAKVSTQITLESDDLEQRTCPSIVDCASLRGFSKSDIEKILKADKTYLAKYDSTSYATVNANASAKLVSGLDYYQVVSLPSINVSAARAGYYISGDTTSCPQYKISPDSSKDCINETIYNTVKKVVSSLKTL